MALSEQDLREIHLTAREIAFEVCKQVNIEHIKSCPHGQDLVQDKIKFKTLTIGIAIGLSLTAVVSGGSAALVLKLLGSI